MPSVLRNVLAILAGFVLGSGVNWLVARVGAGMQAGNSVVGEGEVR
jgi:hypothetical protein